MYGYETKVGKKLHFYILLLNPNRYSFTHIKFLNFRQSTKWWIRHRRQNTVR